MARMKLSYSGIGKVALTNPRVGDLIARKTAAIRNAAGPDAESGVNRNRSRHRGYVLAPADQEVTDAVLSRALDAARDV